MSRVRRPALGAAIVGLIVAVAWWQLLWQPQSAALADAHERSARASAALFDTGQRIGHLKRLAANAGQLAALDQRIQAAAPPSDDLDGFLLSLNAMAQSANVAVRSLVPAAPAPAPGGLIAIGVRMTVEGGYFDVQRLLDELKSGPRLVILDGLNETPIGGQTPSGSKVSAQISSHLLSGLAPGVKIPVAGAKP